jgi:putative ABC transport system substrate-binding protein
MRRRDFINFVGGAAAKWPLRARAQQPVMPLIGLLAAPNAASYGLYVDAFRQA